MNLTVCSKPLPRLALLHNVFVGTEVCIKLFDHSRKCFVPVWTGCKICCFLSPDSTTSTALLKKTTWNTLESEKLLTMLYC